jgi:hypothetical protein
MSRPGATDDFRARVGDSGAPFYHQVTSTSVGIRGIATAGIGDIVAGVKWNTIKDHTLWNSEGQQSGTLGDDLTILLD